MELLQGATENETTATTATTDPAEETIYRDDQPGSALSTGTIIGIV